MLILNGQVFDLYQGQVLDGFQYPPGWFLDPDNRATLDLVEVDDPLPPTVTATQQVALQGFEYMNSGYTYSWQPIWSITDKTPDQLAADAAALAASIETAISKCYTDTDAITAAAIGTRIEEYRQAEDDARAFVAAGYEGDTTLYVSAYAQYNPTGQIQTNQWAAESIIANADAYREAQTQMRAKRFEYQAKIRAATKLGELAEISAGWDQFIAAVRSALGV